jgi:tetratricopeptide (TPR) repeat protein
MPGTTISLCRPLIRLLFVACLGATLPARADDLRDVQRLFDSGQSAAAMQRADQSLATNPKDPQMRFLKGVMLADMKRETEAIAIFQQLSEDYPDLSDPYNNLAALHAARGDHAKARAALEQALRNNPMNATAHENLGDVYAALAGQSYTRAMKLDPGNSALAPKLALVRSLYRHSDRGAAPAPAASSPPQ